MAEINVTPLVDVMLVLLVIFMVTAPIIQQGVSVDLPTARVGALGAEEPPLIVSVTRRGVLYLDDQTILLADLTKRLERLVRDEPARPLFVRADSEVPYGEVVAVMATVKDAGVERVGLITRPAAE